MFIKFVLSHYVANGVKEPDPERHTPLLRLKYQGSIADAIAALGDPKNINQTFAGFQRCLFQEAS